MSKLLKYKTFIKTNENENIDDDMLNDDINDTDDDILEFDIPTWAVSSLINGDDSGLEDDDIAKIDKFCAETVEKYGNAHFMLGDKSDDYSFKWHNDIDGNLGADVTVLYLRSDK